MLEGNPEIAKEEFKERHSQALGDMESPTDTVIAPTLSKVNNQNYGSIISRNESK